MHATLHSLHGHDESAMSTLFTRFVAGEISESAWDEIMRIFDAGEASAEERIALASFISDAWVDLGPNEVEVPKVHEVHDFVTIARAA